MRALKGKTECIACGKEKLSINEIGLNKKFLGRKITVFYCASCLASELELTPEQLLDAIEIFKEQGCTLFD